SRSMVCANALVRVMRKIANGPFATRFMPRRIASCKCGHVLKKLTWITGSSCEKVLTFARTENRRVEGGDSMKGFLIATLVLLIFSAAALSQSINATVGGTVTDASGALIPGVMVTATNTATGVITTALTNDSGTYSLASLQPGSYKVTAELG